MDLGHTAGVHPDNIETAVCKAAKESLDGANTDGPTSSSTNRTESESQVLDAPLAKEG